MSTIQKFKIIIGKASSHLNQLMGNAILRFWVEIVGDEEEHIYGGGEQYTYLDLKGRTYPIWVREQGVGRNKSSIVTIGMDYLNHGGGDYHTSYWPQASYLSSRKYYIESTFPGYQELNFTLPD